MSGACVSCIQTMLNVLFCVSSHRIFYSASGFYRPSACMLLALCFINIVHTRPMENYTRRDCAWQLHKEPVHNHLRHTTRIFTARCEKVLMILLSIVVLFCISCYHNSVTLFATTKWHESKTHYFSDCC